LSGAGLLIGVAMNIATIVAANEKRDEAGFMTPPMVMVSVEGVQMRHQTPQSASEAVDLSHGLGVKKTKESKKCPRRRKTRRRTGATPGILTLRFLCID
jgi:hypothetical protein